MAIKLGGWANDPVVAMLCDRLAQVEGAVEQKTPQRCHVKLRGATVASLGVDRGRPVVEFRPRLDDYAAAHGSRFVRPHPLTAMARDGWLQAHPADRAEAERVLDWIMAAVKNV